MPEAAAAAAAVGAADAGKMEVVWGDEAAEEGEEWEGKEAREVVQMWEWAPELRVVREDPDLTMAGE